MNHGSYDSWVDAVLDEAIDPCEALSRWLDGEDASDHDWRRTMDVNNTNDYYSSWYRWFWSLNAADRHGIMGQVVERYYPDGCNGFANDLEGDDLQLGVQHGF